MTDRNIRIATFSGVDGAGKTTILRRFVDLLETKYNISTVEIRHRPSVLPILSSLKYGRETAEIRTTEVLPRTGQNDSKISSYLRFFYYLSDYFLGQWVNYFKYTRKGVVIVYDRYYFDFIVDAKRTNINLNSRFIRYFYRFVFQPEMNIFLYADSAEILSRKQEMDAESIEELTKAYKALFADLSHRSLGQYMSIENLEIDETVLKVESVYRLSTRD